MSDSNDTLPPGQIRFLDAYQPGLKDGTYTITVQQTLTAANASVPAATQQFVVAGPRFALDPADIHAQFPPNGASSQFGEVLPHVVLNKRLLPWERDIPGLSDTVPWVALLVFEEGELIGDGSNGGGTVANYAQTMPVDQLLNTPASAARVPQLDPQTLSDDDRAMQCQVITMTGGTFAAIVPTARELPYLAHAREVDISGKTTLSMQNAGLFSVIVANRFPQPGDATRGDKAIAHLVSLEGFGDLLNGAVPVIPPAPLVKLVSLYSWSFSCLPDPQQRFSGLAQNLAYDGNGVVRAAASLALRLPLPAGDGGNGAGYAAAARQRLADGYVALGYHAPTGEDGFAWYRGPCTPFVARTVAKTGPLRTAAAAVIYDPATGVFDHSLAAAWQCGRALALADQSFATTLMRLRGQARDLMALQALRQAPSRAAAKEALHTQLGAMFAGGTVEAIRQASTAMQLPRPPEPRRRALSQPPMAAVRMLRMALAAPATQAAIADQLAGNPDADAIARWLARLQLLYGLPFAHIVPDARMLPAEAIRFFYLDPNWVGAMIDGALSIGLGTSEELALQDALTFGLEQMATADALAYRANSSSASANGNGAAAAAAARAAPVQSGFLIRSALVSGWPGLVVSGTKRGSSAVPLLRVDHLAADVLLCLFNGVPDAVTLEEPHEGLEFGVDDEGQLVTRVVTPPRVSDGAPVTIYDPQHPGAARPTLRGGGRRVLNVNSDPAYPTSAAPAAPSDLLGTLAQALKVGTAAIGPADFAVQMVKGPEEITFTAAPPAKPA